MHSLNYNLDKGHYMSNTLLADIANYINGYAFKPSDWAESGNYPIIRIQNLTGSSKKFNFFSGENIPNQRYVVSKGDILISWSGSMGVFQWQGPPALLNQHIFKVSLNQDLVEPHYFIFAMRSLLNIMSRRSHGSTMKHITKGNFKQLSINLPIKHRQAEIADILLRMDTLIELRVKMLKVLDKLIKSYFVEMFGDLNSNPNNWEFVSLGSVCDVRDGTHDSPKYYDQGYPLVTSKNVTSGKIDLINCNLISADDFKKINERSKVDFGDILMPMIGTVGKPVIVDINAEFAIKNVALIKFNDNSQVLNIFIKELLKSDYFDKIIKDKLRGGTQKFISLGDIRRLTFSLPPLAIQNQFATFVTQVEKSKSTIEKNLKKLKTLQRSLMNQYFG